ncbi:hypothetical protein [Micromonospora yangpuensis]|uniref:Uncharacterized protein n=1 Tax=Micromonospora yangpuensis TaxID=683228 RepID=A0A1C6VBN6_9ACTN|nr:hypothetical protein [Micromonospora yangpuensis]SCL63718.1 hypothetical protein GA0070617_5280 [Micromonospora yangpuensis]
MPKNPESQRWANIHAAVEYHFLHRFGQPPSTKVPVNGTEVNLSQILTNIRRLGFPKACPVETRDLIELYRDMGAFPKGSGRRGESGWADLHAAVEYHVANRFGQPPSTEVPVNGIEVDLSKALSNIRRQGFPEACPAATRDLIELYRDMGAFSRGGSARRGESGWAVVHAAVEYHVANRFGQPSSTKVPVGDMEVDLNQILSNIRHRGYPKDCPVATSDLIESQSAAGAFGRGPAGSMPKRQPQPQPQPVPEMDLDLDLDPELVQGLGVSGLSAWPGQAGGVATAAALVPPAARSQHAPAGYAPYDPAPGSSSNNGRSRH